MSTDSKSRPIDELVQGRLSRRADLGDEGPAVAGPDQGLHRPRPAKLVAVLPRLIDVERVVGVLDRGDPDPGLGEGADDPGRERGLSAPAVAREPDDGGAADSAGRRPPTRALAPCPFSRPGVLPAGPPSRLRSSSRFTLRNISGEVGEVDDGGLLLREPAVDLALPAREEVVEPRARRAAKQHEHGVHPFPVVRDRDVRLALDEGGVEPRPERRIDERRVAGNDEHELGGGGREGARHARERTLEPVHPVRDDRMAVAGVGVRRFGSR